VHGGWWILSLDRQCPHGLSRPGKSIPQRISVSRHLSSAEAHTGAHAGGAIRSLSLGRRWWSEQGRNMPPHLHPNLLGLLPGSFQPLAPSHQNAYNQDCSLMRGEIYWDPLK
jgi:cytochrome c peroxidase